MCSYNLVMWDKKQVTWLVSVEGGCLCQIKVRWKVFGVGKIHESFTKLTLNFRDCMGNVMPLNSSQRLKVFKDIQKKLCSECRRRRYEILPTRDIYILPLAFPHLESPHPAGERRPSPEGSPAGSAAAAGSAGSVPRPAGAPWLQRGDGLVDHSLSRCPGDAAKFGPTPTPQSVASGAPVL